MSIMKNLLFFALSCWVTSCVSSQPSSFSEADIAAQRLPRSGVGMLGLELSSEGIPEDFVWDVLLELKNVSTGETLVLEAPARDFSSGNDVDTAPWVHSLPAGEYDFLRASLLFPADKNDLYAMSDASLILAPSVKIPRLHVVEGGLLYLGEISVEGSSFVAGTISQKSKVMAKWEPSSPIAGNIWRSVRAQVPIFGLRNYVSSMGSSDKNQTALLMFERTTEAALEAMKSGFSDSYSLVFIRSEQEGYAFFEDALSNAYRVKSHPVGNFHAFAFAASAGEKLTLRGFCFAPSEKNQLCAFETLKVPFLPSVADFVPSEIRYRGTLVRADADNVILSPVLNSDTESSLSKELLNASFRSFVFGDAPLLSLDADLVFLNAQEARDQWTPEALGYLKSISQPSRVCDAGLRRQDPFVTSAYDIRFELDSSGRFVSSSGGVKELGAAAGAIVVPCLVAEIGKWSGAEKTELRYGFTLRFEQKSSE
jgi:hypothetical protein